MQSRYKISRELAQTSAKFFKMSRGPARLCLSLDMLGALNFLNSNLQKVGAVGVLRIISDPDKNQSLPQL
jgi:hypothetical protein